MCTFCQHFSDCSRIIRTVLQDIDLDELSGVQCFLDLSLIHIYYNGDPASALLEVLDPEQNHTFTDHYLNVPYDLSKVFFVCTANTTDTIPEPLLNRMEVISFNGYTEVEKLQIARRHLIPKAMDAMGIPEKQLDIKEEALRKIITDYTMESGAVSYTHLDVYKRQV